MILHIRSKLNGNSAIPDAYSATESAQPFISYDLLNNLKFNYSTEQQKIDFDKKVTSIMDLINVTQRELFILNKMKTLIISQISKR